MIESELHSFKINKISPTLNSPWSIAILPNDEGILITEKPGLLKLLKEGKLYTIENLPDIKAIGQGGLLDILLDPHFEQNRYVYFSYSEAKNFKYGTVVARAKLNNLALESLEVIFKADPKVSGGVHFGSRLVFDNNSYLYITLGERGTSANAQDLSNHLGSVLRINKEGTIPLDNPFINNTNIKSEIFTYGHRNAQGIAFNELTGNIWIHEHGPKGGDEINILSKGKNFGWPLITYGINYDGSIISEKTKASGLEQPLIYWVPSIAPSGMAFYYGDSFPNWKGDLFVGALAGKHLRRIALDGNKVIHQEILLPNLIGRIRDVRVGSDGFIYIINDQKRGHLYRIEPQ